MFMMKWFSSFTLFCLLQAVVLWRAAPVKSSGIPARGPTILTEATGAPDAEFDGGKTAAYDIHEHCDADGVCAERTKPGVEDAPSDNAGSASDRYVPGAYPTNPRGVPTSRDSRDNDHSYADSHSSFMPTRKFDTYVSVCDDIRAEYDRNAFLTLVLREKYCASKCSFLKYITCVTEPKRELTIVSDVKKWFKNFDADSFYVSNEQPDIVTPEVMVIWWRLGARAWMITLGVIPVLLNQSKVLRGKFWWSSAMICCFGAIHFLGFCSLGITLNNVLLTWLSLVSPPGSTALPQYIIMTIGTLGAAWSAFLTGPAVQVSITFMVFVGYGMFIQAAFFHRGKSTSFGGVAVVLVQMMILSEQLHIAYHEYELKSYTAMLLEYIIGSYLPYGGSQWYFLNSVYMSQRLARVLDCAKFGFEPSLVAMNLVVVQIMMLLFSRACVGSYYLYSLRCRFEIEALWLGFWTYVIDVGGPLRTLYRQFFRLEEQNHRKLLYGVAGTAMAASELYFAFEFLLMRCFATLVDRLFIKSPYGKATHYLAMDIDCDGAYLHELFDHARTYNVSNDGAYPHPTAGAWHDGGKLHELGQSVGCLTVVTQAGKKLRGVAMAVAGRTGTLLYSVLHVTANAKTATFKGHRLQDPTFRTVSEGTDPVTSTICDIPGGPHLSLLVAPEIKKITTLVCLNRTGGELGLDKKVVQSFVKDWSVDKFTGDLRVCANLREGDSGGPLIAVLTGGEFRLAGVVSRGSSAAPGNHVSLVVSKANMYDSDSDSEYSVQQFNAVRRHVGRISDEDADRLRYQAYGHLHIWFDTNKDLLVEMRDWSDHFEFDDFPHCDKRVDDIVSSLKREGDADTVRGRDGDNDPADADEGGGQTPPGRNSGRNKRRKSVRRDRAAIKRVGLVGALLRERLLRIYSEEDAKAIFDFTMCGKLASLPKRGFVHKVSDGMVTYHDALPDHFDYG